MRLRKDNLKEACHNNERARRWYKERIQQAEEATKDARKSERMKRHECKVCFYLYPDRIGGSAITTQPCACCEVEMDFCNTNTDKLCLACAQKHKLCRHCMADIELRSRRKEGWPQEEKKDDALS
jgi:hypothetical protein